MNISSNILADGSKVYSINLTEAEWNELTGVNDKKPRFRSLKKITADAHHSKIIFTVSCKRFLRLKEKWMVSSFKTRLKILTDIGLTLDKAVDICLNKWEDLPEEVRRHSE